MGVSQPGEARSPCPWQMLFVQVVSLSVHTVANIFYYVNM